MTSIKEAALVTAIYESLGFEESLPAYRTFKATCHAWTESYKNRIGIQESHLTKWKSATVRHELHKMAESFLMDHGFEYWPPQTDNVETLQYPGDEERIAELLEQLFWRFNFNTYRYHKYVRKDTGDEQESRNSYDSSVSTFERTSDYTNGVGSHTRPILSESCPPRESIAHGNLVDIASAAAEISDITTTISHTDTREAGWLDANAQTTESIVPGEERVPAQPRKPIVKLKLHSFATIAENPGVSHNCHSKRSKDPDDRTRDPTYNDTSMDNEPVPQRRKLTHGGASSPKRMTHGTPAKTLRSSNRKRTQNPKYADDVYNVETTDSDESEVVDSPKTQSHYRQSKAVEESSAAVPRHSKHRSSQQQRLSGENNNLPSLRSEQVVAKDIDVTTLARESANPKLRSDTDIVPRVAPTAIMISQPSETSGLRVSIPVPNDTSIPPPIETDSPQTTTAPSKAQYKLPLAEAGREQKTQSVPQVQSKPPTSRSRITVEYRIIKTRTPLHLSYWEDGKFAGRSLQSVIESISKIVGRDQIESLICTLYTPGMNMDFTIRNDAEAMFENMKRQYSEIMVSSYRRFGQEKPFEIHIEPTYSDKRRDESSLNLEPIEMDEW
ncbi:hypothetical protein MMC17_009324 [Xylographa soralifera]|nr:hypothetical protein [Xylographa soralifera]